jgi:hypothetical protein
MYIIHLFIIHIMYYILQLFIIHNMYYILHFKKNLL